MKHTLLLTLSSFAMATLMTACTSQMASVGLSTADKEQECANINKKLVKTDRFLEVVNTTSNFHLEELATAVVVPGITVSNNKQKMLKDGNKKKSELLAEHQKLGCEPIEE